MRMNDFEKMQRDLKRMKNNLENIGYVEEPERIRKGSTKRGRRAVEREINRIKHPKVTKLAKEEQIIVLATIVIVAITFIFSGSIFARTISENTVEKQETIEERKNEEQEIVHAEEPENANNEETTDALEKISDEEIVLESNENAIELEDILMENVSVLKSKEYAEETRPIAYEVEYTENPNLPEGEENVIQDGADGKEQVTVIKSYENNTLVGENILETIPMENAIPQIIEKGTSKFLAENQVYLGDTMYVTKEVTLRSEASENADEVYMILESLDVTLEELDGEYWCKVAYGDLEGYLKCEDLTSSIVMPEIVDANRRQKIKMNVREDMPLNESTDLTLEDYQKMLTGNAQDRNNVIADNAEVFYNMDKTYHLNGVFLASMAIHESAWATSTISKDKRNLFGYGAYDSSPYQSSYSFDTYAEGIELVAKALVKYYLNVAGTPIYEDEVAKGSYYNGPTAAGVNIRYASDVNWHNKVFKYMSYLYNRL